MIPRPGRYYRYWIENVVPTFSIEAGNGFIAGWETDRGPLPHLSKSWWNLLAIRFSYADMN